MNCGGVQWVVVGCSGMGWVVVWVGVPDQLVNKILFF